MWIKKMYATFGVLDNKELELREGLNIVYGSNETGKSTWSAFIRAMLYGISTREKARAGYLPDKEKYRPWNGSPMYGRMELSRGGEDIEIERTSGRTGVFSKEEARNITRGGNAPTGEELVGVARGVYERSAFIAQAKIGIDRDADTEKKILSLASSGDEEVSALEVKAILEKKQREIRSPRGLGELPETEKEILRIEREVTLASETEEEIARVTESLEANTRLYEKCARDLAVAEAEEGKRRREYIADATENLKRCEAEAKALEASPARDVYDSFAVLRAQWREMTLSAREAESEANALLRDCEQAEAEAAVFAAFEGMSAALASACAEQDKARLAACAKKKISLPGAAALAGAMLLAACGAVFSAWFAAAAAFLAVVGVCLLVTAGRKEKKLCITELCERYGKAEPEAIDEALRGFCAALSKKEEMRTLVQEKKLAAAALRNAADMRENDLKATLCRFGIASDDIAEGEKTLRDMVEKRALALRAANDARIRVEAIEQSADAESKTVEYEKHEIPAEGAAEIREKLSSLALLRKNYELSLAALRERLAGFDRRAAEGELASLRERASEMAARFDAYSLAMKTVTEADEELRNRFSPEVEKRASEIFAALTGGSFEVVRIKSSDFEMEVAAGAASVRRDTLSLSRGTLDELYFSLRLALCEMILPQDDAPPMVLDDVFVNFDDERCIRALELLREMAKTRQVILFSCHAREAALFENNKEVNVVRL